MALTQVTKPLPIKEAAARWHENVQSILAQARDNDIRLSGLVVNKYLAFGTAVDGDGPFERHTEYFHIPSTQLIWYRTQKKGPREEKVEIEPPDDISSILLYELKTDSGELVYPMSFDDDEWINTTILLPIDKIFIMPDEVARLDKLHEPFLDNWEAGGDQDGRRPANQAKKTRKERLASLEKVKKELEKVERDKSVVVARLMDEHEAKGHHIVEIFKIELPSDSETTTPQKDKEKKAYRLRDSGRKTLLGRLEVK